ncbi:50S ribosomal protein L35 [Patescibacteria group bacterium]
MPKIKTHKGASKRFRVSGGKKKKVMQRSATQGHFNARESGTVTRAKRKDSAINKTNERRLQKLLPNK